MMLCMHQACNHSHTTPTNIAHTNNSLRLDQLYIQGHLVIVRDLDFKYQSFKKKKEVIRKSLITELLRKNDKIE